MINRQLFWLLPIIIMFEFRVNRGFRMVSYSFMLWLLLVVFYGCFSCVVVFVVVFVLLFFVWVCCLNRDPFILFWGAPSFSSYLCRIYCFVFISFCVTMVIDNGNLFFKNNTVYFYYSFTAFYLFFFFWF